MCLCTHVCMHVHVCMCVCMHARVCIHVHVCDHDGEREWEKHLAGSGLGQPGFHQRILTHSSDANNLDPVLILELIIQ